MCWGHPILQVVFSAQERTWPPGAQDTHPKSSAHPPTYAQEVWPLSQTLTVVMEIRYFLWPYLGYRPTSGTREQGLKVVSLPKS